KIISRGRSAPSIEWQHPGHTLSAAKRTTSAMSQGPAPVFTNSSRESNSNCFSGNSAKATVLASLICYSSSVAGDSTTPAPLLNGKLMPATILDGKALAQRIERELALRVQFIKQSSSGEISPTLATILVGDDPSSATYVRMKGRACERVGMKSIKIVLPQATTTDELLTEISRLNADPGVHGILLQHPVPSQINERRCFDQIALEKDVDGVTALGFGKMSMNEAAYGAA